MSGLIRRLPLPCMLVLILTCWGTNVRSEDSPKRKIVKFQIDGRTYEAAPLMEASDGILMLARDGQVITISKETAKTAQVTTTGFTPLPLTALRNQLEQEFGRNYEVTSTGHYLVVHPRGNGDQWSRRFEELYRSFGHYFSIRGFKISEPEFPLVAVVLPTEAEFYRYAALKGDDVPTGVLGYYSPVTNRVALFDVSGGANDEAWVENATTIIHEATHQTAFNTGIHHRLFPTPYWVAEGLGTLFEAEGVWNARHNVRSSDRINKQRLAQFKKYLPRRKEDAFMQLLAGDTMFRTDPDGAYAEAWAWTYYLTETRPKQYTSFLKRIQARGELATYSMEDRVRDFAAEFGTELKHLDAQFVRYMQALK